MKNKNCVGNGCISVKNNWKIDNLHPNDKNYFQFTEFLH